MDINNTPLYLIHGARDWQRVIANGRGMQWDPVTATARLTQIPQRFEQPGAGVLDSEQIRGAAADVYGHVYWINDDRRSISVLSVDAQDAASYWRISDALSQAEPESDFFHCAAPPPDWATLRLAGLTATSRGYLIAGTRAPGGLLVFDLHAGGPPVHAVWPEALAFVPFALAADPDGGVWILDRGDVLNPARVWHLDRHLRPTGADWQPEPSGSALDVCDDNTSAQADSFRLDEIPPIVLPGIRPQALAAVDARSFLLLTNAPGEAHSELMFVHDGVATSVALNEPLDASSPAEPFPVRGHALAYLSSSKLSSSESSSETAVGRESGTVFIAADDGNQAFAYSLQAEGAVFEVALMPDFWPMRRFRGRNLVARGAQVLYDSDSRWIPLTAHPRRRFAAQGTARGLHFDSGLPGCVWHRVMLDACIPDGVAVQVWARAADRVDDLARQAMTRQPDPYLRGVGSEVAFHDPFAEHPGETSGTFETLLQDPVGRHVELELRIHAGGRVSPGLKSVRVYGPRFSYLERYLPDIYQRDAQSGAFLERFLANVEGLFTTMEEFIANAEGLFDPRITTPDYLDWLSGWFGTCLDADWEDWRKRAFLHYAEALYRWRGTLPGLYAMLSLAVDECVDVAQLDRLRDGGPLDSAAATAGFRTRIVERYLLRLFGGLSLGDPTEVQPGLLGAETPWTPEQGTERLHKSWRDFLDARGDGPVSAVTTLSPTLPATSAQAWREFMDSQEFVYPSIDVDATDSYRLFLQQRYLTVDALNQAYGWTGSDEKLSFQAVTLPAENDFPAAGPRLYDWMTFATLALPISLNAHRFSVLVPTAPDETDDARQLRMERVAALVEREKPAHTTFDVQPFWALFQVGTARLGLDSVLGEGARFTAIQLGRTGTGEGTLAYGHPWNLADRAIAGRDTASEMRL